MYADDTTTVVSDDNRKALIDKMEMVIKDFRVWCHQNNLKFYFYFLPRPTEFYIIMTDSCKL